MERVVTAMVRLMYYIGRSRKKYVQVKLDVHDAKNFDKEELFKPVRETLVEASTKRGQPQV